MRAFCMIELVFRVADVVLQYVKYTILFVLIAKGKVGELKCERREFAV